MTNYLDGFTQVITLPTFIMFMAGAMSALLLIIYTESAIALRRRAGKVNRLRSTVLARLAADVDITPADLDRFRNAHNLDGTTAKRVLDGIYAEPPSKDTAPVHLARLRSLLDEIEANDPYDHLPVEVRPSLVRIQDILASSRDGYDNAVLAPILTALNEGVGLARQKRRLNMHRNIAYCIGVVSLLIGVTSLYLTPSERQLAHAIAAEMSSLDSPAMSTLANPGDAAIP